MTTHILRIDCPDRKGLIYDISRIVFAHNLNIISNDEFVDNHLNQFYLRAELAGACNHQQVLTELQAVLPSEADIWLTPPQKKNIVILVTKEHHCLGDLLLRHEFNDLQANILAVVGNYNVLEPLVTRFQIAGEKSPNCAAQHAHNNHHQDNNETWGFWANQGNQNHQTGGKGTNVKLPFRTDIPQLHFESDGTSQPHHDEGCRLHKCVGKDRPAAEGSIKKEAQNH